MNELQKGFWGLAGRGAMSLGRGLRAAYSAGATRAGDMGANLYARRGWQMERQLSSYPRRMASGEALAAVENMAGAGRRLGRGAFHVGAAGLGAFGASRMFGGGRRREDQLQRSAPAGDLRKGWMGQTRDDYRRASRRDDAIEAGLWGAPAAAVGGTMGAAYGRSRGGRLLGAALGAAAVGGTAMAARYGWNRAASRGMEDFLDRSGGFDAPGEKKPSGWAAWRAKQGDRDDDGPSVLPDYDGDELHFQDRRNGGFIIQRGENSHYLTDDEFGQYQRQLRRQYGKAAPAGDLQKGLAGELFDAGARAVGRGAYRGLAALGRDGLGGAAMGAGRRMAGAYMAGARKVGGYAQRFTRDALMELKVRPGAAQAGDRALLGALPRSEMNLRTHDPRSFGQQARMIDELKDRGWQNAQRLRGLAQRAAGERLTREIRDPVKGAGRLAVAGYHGAAGLGALGLGRWAMGGRDRTEKAAPTGDLAKALTSLPLAKRAALADAIEGGDAAGIRRALG